MRWIWLLTGHLLVIVGIAGVFLPMLPGTPLLILAAACYSKGSEKFENWLLTHKRYGPVIKDWRAYRVIPFRAKTIAILFIFIGLCFPLFIVPTPLVAKIIALIVMPIVALFIISCPSRPPDIQDID